MLERLRATSQMLEKTKPSTPFTSPWKPSSRLDLATEQTKDWKRASAGVSSTAAPPPRRAPPPPSGPGRRRAGGRGAPDTVRGPGQPSCRPPDVGGLEVGAAGRGLEEAVEEKRPHLGRERPGVVRRAQEGAGRDAVEHAEEEIGRRQQLVARAAVGVELAQDRQAPREIRLPLGRDLVAPRPRDELPVAVDDLERGGVAEAKAEVGADQREASQPPVAPLGEGSIE